MTAGRVPFTILTGWLGAGKTTALNRMLAIVKRDGKRLVAQRCRAIDELFCRVRDMVNRVVRRVRVEFDFEHEMRSTSKLSSHCRNAAGTADSADRKVAGRNHAV